MRINKIGVTQPSPWPAKMTQVEHLPLTCFICFYLLLRLTVLIILVKKNPLPKGLQMFEHHCMTHMYYSRNNHMNK